MHHRFMLCTTIALLIQPLALAAEADSNATATDLATTQKYVSTPYGWRLLVYVRDNLHTDHNYISGVTEGSGAIVETDLSTGKALWTLLDGKLKLAPFGEQLNIATTEPGSMVETTLLHYSDPNPANPEMINENLIALHEGILTHDIARHAPFLTGPTWDRNGVRGATLEDAISTILSLDLEYEFLPGSIQTGNPVVINQHPDPGATLSPTQNKIYIETAAAIGREIRPEEPSECSSPCDPKSDDNPWGSVDLPIDICSEDGNEFSLRATVRSKCCDHNLDPNNMCTIRNKDMKFVDWTWKLPTCDTPLEIKATCKIGGTAYHSLMVVGPNKKPVVCDQGVKTHVNTTTTPKKTHYLSVVIPFHKSKVPHATKKAFVTLKIKKLTDSTSKK